MKDIVQRSFMPQADADHMYRARFALRKTASPHRVLISRCRDINQIESTSC
jgi:hypothetical protein